VPITSIVAVFAREDLVIVYRVVDELEVVCVNIVDVQFSAGRVNAVIVVVVLFQDLVQRRPLLLDVRVVAKQLLVLHLLACVCVKN